MTYTDAQGILRTLVIDAVAQKSDVYYEYKVKDLATHASRIFNHNRHRTQIKNLVNVALSATSYAEVLNYIKSQAGKENSLWREGGINSFAHTLIKALNESVVNDATHLGDGIWKAVKKIAAGAEAALKAGNFNDADLKRVIRLELVRIFVQHLEARYLYPDHAEV